MWSHVSSCTVLLIFVAHMCDNSWQKIQLLIELVFGLVAQNSTQLVASLFLVGCSHVLHFALVVMLSWLPVFTRLAVYMLFIFLNLPVQFGCIHILVGCPHVLHFLH